MFQKVLEYAGEYRKTTYLSMVVMLIGIVMNVLPFLFIYQLIRPLLLGGSLELGYAAWRVAAIAVCGILYAVLYVKGLSLSHRAAYNTLKNLRISLQGKLERQPPKRVVKDFLIDFRKNTQKGLRWICFQFHLGPFCLAKFYSI